MAKTAQNSLIALGTEKWRKQRIPSLRRHLDPHGSSARSPAGTGVAKIAHRDGMRPSASIPQPPLTTCRSALASRLVGFWLEVSRGDVAMSRRIEASVERDLCHHEGGIVPSRAKRSTKLLCEKFLEAEDEAQMASSRTMTGAGQ